MKISLQAILLMTTSSLQGISAHLRNSHQHDGVPVHGPNHNENSATPPTQGNGNGVIQFSMGKTTKDTNTDGSNGNQDYETHIVGGEQSQPGEFPYYVDMDGCGGSLIAPGVVLSAAHCGDYNGETVIVGAYEAGSTSNNAVSRRVADSRAHPGYNSNTEQNDFMLIRLQNPVTMNGNINLVLNTEYGTPQNNQDLTVLGLGLVKEDGNTPRYLRDVVVQAVTTSECNSRNSYDGEVDDATMFCAGVDGGGKDSCHGDSGGPIIIRNGNTHVQVGVVSWGIGCARSSYPGVYSRVSSSYDWIKSVVCDEWGESASFCDGSGGGGGGGGGDGGGGGGGDGSCVDLLLELRTDDYGDETDFFLVTENGTFIWDEWDFRDNRRYDYSACVDPQGCATLDFFDSWGDGISSPGYLKLTYDGTVVFNSGDIGSGKIFRFGHGC